MTIGKYIHPENNPVLQAAKKNNKSHGKGVEKNIHEDQISGWDNMTTEKMAKDKINVNKFNK